jgi:CII-binding regulator of phage lambda lysogenization HflD
VATDTPSLGSARDAWVAADKEEAFWRDHYGSYLDRYPDRFVAVYGGRVVATSPDLRHLVGILEGKGLDIQRVWVRYIAATSLHSAL